ncbi:basic leucine zipper 4-like [Phoenix dactylifera]|uniref:Basic leucine zipper 4-like n=1 Tax=Phoenix dactylifera TaxID=42345 RepID=A0A8B8ZCE6_PHODC|nr:basic leucine zipper 4-like [Phoenix dactylifera]
MSLDEFFSIPFPALEGEFGFTPWPAPAPAPTPTPTASLEEPLDVLNWTSESPLVSPISELCENQAALSPSEKRRLKRRISNRLSARRSRMRKQHELEELRSQVARLRSENQDLVDRLIDVSNLCLLFRHDNDRLRAYSAALHRRLFELRRHIVLQ